MHEIPVLLVEDESSQATRARRILEPLGFVVETLGTAEEARHVLEDPGRNFDLIVLDRRLPYGSRDEPQDAVGDELLEFVCDTSPDSLVIFLTGRASVSNVQNVMTARGEIVLDSEVSVNRVRHFEKTDYDGFEGYARTISSRVRALSDYSIQMVGGRETDEIESRLLAKVVRHVGGEAAVVNVLEGGLTDDSVYKIQVLDSSGTTIGRLIVKTGLKSRGSRPVGNYHLVLRSAMVAMPFARVGGLARGREAQLIQDAGVDGESLFALLRRDERLAVEVLEGLIRDIDAHLEDSVRVLAVSDLVQPFLTWNKLKALSVDLRVGAVSDSLRVHTSTSPQHGDFHGANILVVDRRPVLIDFDRERVGSRCLDPITLLLSSMLHPASPVDESEWMKAGPVDIIGDSFLDGCPYPHWFETLRSWARRSSKSDREFHGLTLAYSVRQTSFPESADRPQMLAWATGIATEAAIRLTKG